jgi:hypothetical protein
VSRTKLFDFDFSDRTLIYNVILSPWNYGGSAHPKANLRGTINNLRIFATVFYEIVRYFDQDIPPVTTASEQ